MDVGSTRGVGVERIKITVEVALGRGVGVLTVGVIVGVGVNDGMDAAVCVDAASTVCAINVLTAPGSIVGTDGLIESGAVVERAVIDKRARVEQNARVGWGIADQQIKIALVGKNSTVPAEYTIEPEAEVSTDVIASDYDGNIVRAGQTIQTRRQANEV